MLPSTADTKYRVIPKGVAEWFESRGLPAPSRTTQYRWLREGKLPAKKMGRFSVINEEHLEAMVDGLPDFQSDAGTDYVEIPAVSVGGEA